MTPRRGQHRATGDGHHRPPWWPPGRRPPAHSVLIALCVLVAVGLALAAVSIPIYP